MVITSVTYGSQRLLGSRRGLHRARAPSWQPSMKRALEKRRREGEDPLQINGAVAMNADNGSDAALQSNSAVRIQGFVVTDHWLTAPLDHFSDGENGETIKVFAREV